MLQAFGNAVVPQQAAPVAAVIYRYVMRKKGLVMPAPEYPICFDDWWLTPEGQAVADVQYSQADDWLTPTEAVRVLWGDSVDLHPGVERLRYYVKTGRLTAYAKPAQAGYRYNDAQRKKRGSQSRKQVWIIRRADLEAFRAEYLPELLEASASS